MTIGTESMRERPPLNEVLAGWRLPEGDDLFDRIERMIRPALLGGYFGSSYTRFVAGLQYHLGGAQDTRELAELAEVSSSDHVLDVCCFIGGPAIQLAVSFGCRVTGVDINPDVVSAANRLAAVTGLSDLLSFEVADACDLPFEDNSFSVVWNQASLEHREDWLEVFNRVLAPGGRLAFTFELRGESPDDLSGSFSKWAWALDELVQILRGMGYCIVHADDITERDIEVGWRALDRKLFEHKQEFTRYLGSDWVQKAHEEFKAEIDRMHAGRWGTGRVIARKPDTPLAAPRTGSGRMAKA